MTNFITSLATLKSTLTDYSHRTDLTIYMDLFIELAEAEINRLLRVPEMEKRVFQTVSDSYIELPSDFLELRNIQIGARQSPSRMTLVQLDKNQESTELSYAITGNQLEIRPTILPADPVEVEINYYAKVPEILDPAYAIPDNDSVILNYPHLYLYASMIEISLFNQDDARVELWNTKFNDKIMSANEARELYLYNGATLSVRS